MVRQEEIKAVLHSIQNIYSIKSVRLFGSFAEGRETDGSDVDLLVEFEQPAVSLITLNRLKYDLEERLGLPVDVVHAPLPKGSLIQPGKVVTLLGI